MDIFFTETLNQLVGRAVGFDLVLDFIQESYLVKGLFAVCVLVMIHSASGDDKEQRQTNVYATIILIFLALFLARVLQMTLPFSPRPLHADGLTLTLAEGLRDTVLKGDSSFPSDHAVMFWTIAASVLLYARAAGAVLLAHAIFIICLPRIILGFHWFSDIAMGALIGVAMALLFHRLIVRWLSGTRLNVLKTRHPALFYGGGFAVLAETATMYRGTRQLLSALADFVRLAV